jgi:hydrogenase small subunit
MAPGRRAFLKFCAVTASLLALPPGAAMLLAQGLERARRLPVVWLSFQECTGCTESLTRSSAPSIERLLFDLISLDYHHTLQAASGAAAEAARETSLKENAGHVLLVVDGSVPTALAGACSTIAGEDNLSLLRRCLEASEVVVAVGTCASFGGLAAAAPNPTGAMGIAELMERGIVPRRPLVNLPGCPPIPEVMSTVLAHRVAFGGFPPLDDKGRPLAFYGETVHDRCSRRGHFEAGRFAKSFDDEGARSGLVPAGTGLQGAGDPQRLFHHSLEWRQQSRRIRTSLPGLRRAGILGPGKFLYPRRAQGPGGGPSRKILGGAWRRGV